MSWFVSRSALITSALRCVTMSASPGMARSFAIPLAALLFTAPTEQPIASAVCVSVRSSQYRRTTASR